jgi:hypothetical protein
MLDSKGLVLVDTGNAVFAWVGKDSDKFCPVDKTQKRNLQNVTKLTNCLCVCQAGLQQVVKTANKHRQMVDNSATKTVLCGVKQPCAGKATYLAVPVGSAALKAWIPVV